MGYIDNYKFREIMKAGKAGSEAANSVLRAIRSNVPQSQLDNLVDEFYKELAKPQVVPEVKEEEKEVVVTAVAPKTDDVVDLTSVLDIDLDGVIPDDDIKDDGFAAFLRDKIRAKDIEALNSDYFKKYDESGRQEYKEKRIAAYKAKLDAFMRKFEREYTDVDNSIKTYRGAIELIDDDEHEDNAIDVMSAYKKLIDDDYAMDALPRYYDEHDKAYLADVLDDLVKTYGKRNVLAAVKGLEYGNRKRLDDIHKRYDEYINRYTEKLSDLLG